MQTSVCVFGTEWLRDQEGQKRPSTANQGRHGTICVSWCLGASPRCVPTCLHSGAGLPRFHTGCRLREQGCQYPWLRVLSWRSTASAGSERHEEGFRYNPTTPQHPVPHGPHMWLPMSRQRRQTNALSAKTRQEAAPSGFRRAFWHGLCLRVQCGTSPLVPLCECSVPIRKAVKSV